MVAGLARRDVAVAVFTDARFREPVERVGGRFVDLFARYPLEAADAMSRPLPCRYVSFAGHYAEALMAEMARLRPALIVYDTFAMIGFVLGRGLGIPYVNVCAGHDMSPAHAIARLEHDRRLALSEAGRRAIDRLRDRWGVLDASPHSYLTSVSPYLNLYCEPEAFLSPDARQALEPIAFFGSLPPRRDEARPRRRRLEAAPPDRVGAPGLCVVRVRGLALLRPEALGALAALAEAVATTERRAGAHQPRRPPAARELRARLRHPGVDVADYVDQWRVLQRRLALRDPPRAELDPRGDLPRRADALVPVLRRPAAAGGAVPASSGCRSPWSTRPGRRSRPRTSGGRSPGRPTASPRLARSLVRAREWEREVLGAREAVIDQILGLAKG